MLTINQYSKTYSPQYTNFAKPQNKPFENKQSVPIQSNTHFYGFKSNKIMKNYMLAKANTSLRITRPATRDSALKEFNKLFLQYKQDLQETSLSDIELTVKQLEQKHPKRKILSTMQQATQFANIKSLKTVIKALNKEKVGSIGDISKTEQPEFVKNNFGLNITLHYLINKKRMGELSGQNNAIFLDKNKLAQLKDEAKTDPSYIKNLVNDSKNKFFVLSGFDNGINFLNRNQKLGDKTLKLIKKDNIDDNIINQALELGINPIVIKNKNEATTKNIYEQMRPEQMTQEELNAVVDANILHTYKYPDVHCDVKSDLIKYLDNNLLVISPETMSNGFADMHKNIVMYNQNLGKTEKDLIYCIPDSEKSYGLINHQYQLTNNINRKQFTDIETLLGKIDSPKLKNKTIVFLDDCAMSGNSMSDNFFPFKERLDIVKKQNINFIYAPFIVTDKSCTKLQGMILENNQRKDKIIFKKKISNDWEKDLKNPTLLSHALGKTAFGYQWQYNEKPCVIFPYMAPDNNCNFAANIALLHDINHNQCNTNEYLVRIKSGCLDTYIVSDLSKKLLEETKKC